MKTVYYIYANLFFIGGSIYVILLHNSYLDNISITFYFIIFTCLLFFIKYLGIMINEMFTTLDITNEMTELEEGTNMNSLLIYEGASAISTIAWEECSCNECEMCGGVTVTSVEPLPKYTQGVEIGTLPDYDESMIAPIENTVNQDEPMGSVGYLDICGDLNSHGRIITVNTVTVNVDF